MRAIVDFSMRWRKMERMCQGSNATSGPRKCTDESSQSDCMDTCQSTNACRNDIASYLKLSSVFRLLTINPIILIAKMRGRVAPKMGSECCVPLLADQGGRAEVRGRDIIGHEIPRIHCGGLSIRWRVDFHDRSIVSLGKDEGRAFPAIDPWMDMAARR